jgi:16S rRNA (cytosine967-C5)-methyltransferase
MNAREIALHIVNEVENNGAYANIVLAKSLTTHQLSDQDRRFVTELVYGTIRSKETIDYFLKKFISRDLASLSPVILNILRLGVYQLVFLTKIPVSAACNQSVELAKKYGHAGTVKFVNGVLRNMARHEEKLTYPDKQQDPVQYLSLVYFHPAWMVERWLKRFGFDETEALCQANNEISPLSLRTNTLKIDRAALLERLRAEEVICEAASLVPEGILCSKHPSLGSLASLKEGLFQVQDLSSMLVAHVLDPKPGEYIIDACSAPGGKSTHIAALMKNHGRILAIDLYEHKLSLIKQNAQRLGIDMIETCALDATNLAAAHVGQADRVLVDAPCSGLGILRHKADARWRKSEALLMELPPLQLAILESAAKCLKGNGILVYSTCTIEPEENGDVIQKFLAAHPEFVLEETGRYLPSPVPGFFVQYLPHKDHQDGFFIARMRRKA